MQKILATLDEFFTVDFWHSGNNHELVSDGVDGVDVKLGHSGIHGDQEKRHELDHLDKIVRVTNFIMPTQVNAFLLLSLLIFFICFRGMPWWLLKWWSMDSNRNWFL